MNASRTTEAAIRHQARIQATKERIAEFDEAQRDAICRGDYATARWLIEELNMYRSRLQTLRTMPIHTKGNAR